MKRWYVVQVYAGYEDAARKDILKRVQEAEAQDLFGQVIIPTTKVKSSLADEAEEQLLFPGYVLVEMEENSPEAIQVVTRSARALRFLGGENPVPLEQSEVDKMVSQVKGEVVIASREDRFTVGAEVEILEGPFTGFVGVVDKVDSDGEKLAVMVSIFGRMTPVELNFNQVRQ